MIEEKEGKKSREGKKSMELKRYGLIRNSTDEEMGVIVGLAADDRELLAMTKLEVERLKEMEEVKGLRTRDNWTANRVTIEVSRPSGRPEGNLWERTFELSVVKVGLQLRAELLG